jgi:AraC-like DNA-binding protein
MCTNLSASKELNIPICQDTGMAVLFCELGQDVHITGGDFTEAVNNGVKKAYLSLLLGKILENCNLENGALSENVTETAVLKFCKENFLEEITIKSVANSLHLSPSHISHIFSSKLKINFRHYVNTLRIDYSKTLLLSGELPITQIALNCGFANLRTFNRAFLSATGKTPTEYKKQKNRG